MIELLQQPTHVVGSRDAVESLSKKESATVLLVSDSHGRSEILRAIIERFGKRADALVFCGDGIADLCACLEIANKHKRFQNIFPPVVAFARGNGDYPEFPVTFNPDPDIFWESYDFDLEVPMQVTVKIAGMNILVLHGHSVGAYYGLGRMGQVALENQADLVFYGHTHIASRQEADCTVFINPGSCTHPRGGQPPGFALVEIPGGQERAETTFFSIQATLSDGLEFNPYVPVPLY